MKILALDVSTKTGWSYLDGDRLVAYGLLTLDKAVRDYDGKYPFNYVNAANDMAERILGLFTNRVVDQILIEETNKVSKTSRYTHKLLEWIHCLLNQKLQQDWSNSLYVNYVNTSVWRKAVGIELTKEDKKNNARLSKAKSKAKRSGVKLDKKALGIKGKVNKKHKAVQLVNKLFNLTLKQKDNDIAEAILIGYSYSKGITYSDGII